MQVDRLLDLPRHSGERGATVMLISMELEELELVTFALDKHLSDHSTGRPTTDATELLKKLRQKTKYERRRLEPVMVRLWLNGDEYFAMLNPETDEVEVRFRGVPVMSGEWESDARYDEDNDPTPRIQRRDEYPNQPQPDDALLEVLSVALRHALVNR
jgi:hypothetical protein